MSRWRRAALAVLPALLAAGCGQAAARPPAAPPADAEHRFVHVHEFRAGGIRIAPPTGTPRLSWRQALAASEDFYGAWDSAPPQVKLADYRDRLRGPVRPVLAWVVVYPAAEVLEFGPDFAPPTVRPQRCPVYVGVDATSGHLLGALQTCDPPYRG